MNSFPITNVVLALMVIILVILWFRSMHRAEKEITELKDKNRALGYDLDFEKKWRKSDKEEIEKRRKLESEMYKDMVSQLRKLNDNINLEVEKRVKVRMFKQNKARICK